MKCLSVRQPWAWLIFHGKDVENRTWRCPRPPLHIAIHAARIRDPDEFESAFWDGRKPGDLLPVMPMSDPRLVYGAIIGTVDVVDCVLSAASPWAVPGSWHWLLSNAVEFAHPIPYHGRLGLFKLPPGLLLSARRP